MCKYSSALARILLALAFLGIVTLKMIHFQGDPDAYEQYIALLAGLGLPRIFASLLILLQLLGGLALFAGWKTRTAAYVMLGYTLFSAVVLGRFQPDAMFLYLGLAGGLMLLACNPVTTCSLDNLKKKQA